MLFVDILGYTLSSDAVCCIILSPMIRMKAMMVLEIQEVNTYYVISVLPYFSSNTILNWEKGYVFSMYHKFMKSSMELSLNLTFRHNTAADLGWQALQWAAIYVEQAIFDNSRTA